MANAAGPNRIAPLPTLVVDAANKQSYPGTGTTWYDIIDRRARYRFSPVVTNPTFNSSNYGNFQFNGSGYYSFNGLSNAIGNSFNLTVTGSSSASIWFKSFDNTKDFQFIFSLTNSWGVFSRSGELYYTARATGPTTTLASNFTGSLSYSIVQDQWYHITMIAGATSVISVYVNGQSILSNQSISSFASATQYQLGRNLFGNIGYFTFYRTILNQKQVYDNYIATRGRFGV
jgi:hypothetical protein